MITDTGRYVPPVVTATLREPRSNMQALSIFGECFPLFGGVHFAVVEELFKQTVKTREIDTAAVCELLQRAHARTKAQNTVFMVRMYWNTSDSLPSIQWTSREGVQVTLQYLVDSWIVVVVGAEEDTRLLTALAPDWKFHVKR